MTSSLYLCVYAEEFAAQALLRLRPELRSRPIAIVEGAAPLEEVIATNRHARDLGVSRSMMKSELDSFDHLVVLRRSLVEEQAARAAVFDIASSLTPRIEDQSYGARGSGTRRPSTPALTKIRGPQHSNMPQQTQHDAGALVLVLDISGSERLFGTPAAMARRLLLSLRSVSIAARCSICSNLPAAVCLARAALSRLTVVAPDRTYAALAPLPLSVLPLAPEQEETLSAWGLRSLGELAALPPLDLVTRLGPQGEYLWQLARGEAAYLMRPEEPGFSLEEAAEFDAAVETSDSLLFLAGPMLDGLIARAGAHALQLASVCIHMQLDGGGVHSRTIRPALPVADRALLLKLVQLDLAAHPPAAGVLLLRLVAEPGPRAEVQQNLFRPPRPEPMRLEVTLARLTALVGEGRVGRPRLTDSHAPESFSVERFTVTQHDTGHPMQTTSTIDTSMALSPRGGPTPEQSQSRCGAGLRRLRPPVPIRPCHQNGVLCSFYMQGTLYDVRERFGPWRRSGHWWSSDIWSREEWDISAQAAASAAQPALLCLITHDLLRDRWQLDGFYD